MQNFSSGQLVTDELYHATYVSYVQIRTIFGQINRYLDQQEQIASYEYGPVPEGDPDQEVQVPLTTCSISQQQFHQLTLAFGMQQISVVIIRICTCTRGQ